jgi:type IV pilus assembly protein PilN
MNPIRINLLPHRQIRKARQQRLFAIFAAVVVGAGLAAVALGQAYLMNAKASQDRRNAFLSEEIARLDKQIAEISQLKAKTQDLLARKDAVESLQSNRDGSVHLFDELARRLPDGLYLKSVKQAGDVVAVSGYAPVQRAGVLVHARPGADRRLRRADPCGSESRSSRRVAGQRVFAERETDQAG